MNAADVMAATVTHLIGRMEQGVELGTLPWHHDGTIGMPHNSITKNVYRGGNLITLWFTGSEHGWASNEWATFKQWQQIGATVRKGERGTRLVYWGTLTTDTDTTETTNGEQADTPAKAKSRQFAKTFVVFNAAQVDGLDLSGPNADPPTGDVARWFDAIPATVEWGKGRPCYRPACDRVTMPHPDAFRDPDAMWATLAHELAHWSGHASRLDRTFGARFGDDTYALEELVAELSAAITCAVVGIATTFRDDHADYLAHWCRVLKADPSILWTVAGKAQAATDHLVTYQPATRQEIAA
jgi:antirestriction protein ArdC